MEDIDDFLFKVIARIDVKVERTYIPIDKEGLGQSM